MYNLTSKYKIIFLMLDILTIIFGFKFLVIISSTKYSFFFSDYFLIFLIFLTLIINLFTEEYRQIEIRGYLKELKYSFVYSIKIVAVFCMLILLLKRYYLADLFIINYKIILLIFFVYFIFTYFFRILGKLLFKKIKNDKKNAILLTDFVNYELFETQICKNYELLAYVNADIEFPLYNNKPVLKNSEDIREFIINNNIDEIFLNATKYNKFKDILKELKLTGIPISINVNEFSNYVGESIIKNVGNIKFITSVVKVITLRQFILKRIMDILGALVGIVITFFVALIIYPIVQRESKGNLIFKQKRVGKNGKIFNIYKFRSMYVDAEERKKELLKYNDMDSSLMFKMKNDPRIFPFGQKMRDWSIDELPQFINVLKGDMSLVGTRPPTQEEYKNYEMNHIKRLATKPGITGLWQVSGRSDIENFEKVIELDLKYIQTWSISLDIKILLKTIKVVLKREGSR